MNKREFLKLLALVLVGGSTHVKSDTQLQGVIKGRPSILVIGAGLAGLAASQALMREGYQVVVLEARERIGGRVWTSRKWSDFPLDLGASWIHGIKGNPITDLADQVGAKRLVTRYENAETYNTDGQLLSQGEEEKLETIRRQMFRVLRKAQNEEIETSVRQAVASLATDWADDPIALRFLDFCLSTDIEQEYAGSADRLSAYWFNSTEEFDGDDALFERGFQIITDYLAQGVDIRLSQVVKEIHWQEDAVRVRTEDSEFVADKVVVTLPLGVLQSGDVRFIPELPDAKRDAIDSLGMGVLNKCYLRFSQAFWPDDIDWLSYVSAQPGEWTDWVSFQRTAQWPILLGFNAADRGRDIESWSDEQAVASAMLTLRTIFGADIPEPIDYQVTRWASDRFARGSYSYNALGSTPGMRDALAGSLNQQLFFAGEATHRNYFSTTHGAYLTGLSAAKEIIFRRS